MNPIWESNEFCNEVFPGTDARARREAALAGMSRAARRRRYGRYSGWVAALILGLTLTSLRQPKIQSPPPSATARPAPHWEVRTAAFAGRVFSAPLPEGLVVRSSPTALTVVPNETGPSYQAISDDELLGMFPGETVALIRENGQVRLEKIEPGEPSL